MDTFDTSIKDVRFYNDVLCHYGVKGMKWKERHAQRKTIRQAKKDAKELARAKMYYGEGAGNRRKLINATINERSKNNKLYKQTLDNEMLNKDWAKEAAGAKSERRRNNIRKSTKKTVRGAFNTITGNPVARSAAGIAVGTAALAYLRNKDKVDNTVKNARLRAKYKFKTKTGQW